MEEIDGIHNSMSVEAEIRQLESEIQAKDDEILGLLEELGVSEGSTSWCWRCPCCVSLNVLGQDENQCEVCLAEVFKCGTCGNIRDIHGCGVCDGIIHSNSQSGGESGVVNGSLGVSRALSGVAGNSTIVDGSAGDSKSVSNSAVVSTSVDGTWHAPTRALKAMDGTWHVPTEALKAMDGISHAPPIASRVSNVSTRCIACASTMPHNQSTCDVCLAEQNESLDVGIWQCYACTSINAHEANECPVCFADRDDVATISKVGWICAACTSTNSQDLIECSVCCADYPNAATTPTEGWICAACASINPQYLEECSVCCADRSEVAATPTKEWTCTACTSANPEHSCECLVCSADREQIMATPVRGWACWACSSRNMDDVAECSICCADREEMVATLVQGWACGACASINVDDAPECSVCYADREMIIDLSIEGKRELLDKERALELLPVLANPELVRVVRLSTKSFGRESSEVAANRLSSMPNIEKADFADIISGRPTDEALAVLERLCSALPLANVTELDLSDNALGERGIRVLSKCLATLSPHVEALTFKNNGLSELSLKLFVDAMGESPAKLRSLHFESNMSGSGGAIALKPLFERMGKYPDVPLDFTMSSCRVRPDGIKALGESLIFVAQKLVSLDISDSMAGKEGATALANALKLANNLTRLSLRDPGIDDRASWNEIVTVFGSGALQRLTYLDLSGATFGPGVANAVFAALEKCPDLETLNVSENEISSTGLKNCLLGPNQSARKFPALRTIDLRENDLNDKCAEAILAFVKATTTLERVELNKNSFSRGVVERFQREIGQHRLGLMNEDEYAD